MLPFAQNAQSVAIKKYMFEMLKERYSRNERFVDRLASTVVTKDDYESLGGLMADVYEAGFVRAVDQYKEQLAKVGMKVSIVPESQQPQGKPIFRG